MPTIDQIRATGEASLQDVLAKLDARHKRKLLAAIQRYGRVQDIPQEFWDELRRDTESETVAALLLIMLAGDDWTTGAINDQGVRFNSRGIPETARYALTAATRARRMAGQTVETIRSRLARKVEDAKLSPRGDVGEFTVDGLDEALDEVLSKSRRETISTNETTGSLTDGQMGAANRARQRVTVEMRWQTEQDNRVCPRCRPLEETPEEVWSQVFPDGPGEAAHPNCRCWLRPVVVVEAE